MKLILFLLLAPLAVSLGEAPVNLSPWNVQAEMQVVTMPEEAALPLISELRNAKRIEAAYAKLQKMIASKEATLIGWPSLIIRSGDKGVIESIDEIRYATEFSLPTIGSELVVAEVRKASPLVFEATPTQFSVRNTGITLEVDAAVLEKGKLIQAAFAVQHVRLKAFNEITLEKPGQGISVVVEQPEFEETKTTTTLRMHNGERILLGVHKTSVLPNQIEIQIIKVEAAKVEGNRFSQPCLMF